MKPAVLELGPPDAPVLVFLHGFLGHPADWRPVMESLAGDFRCIAPVLHGAAEGMSALLDALRHRLHEHRIQRCGVIGYSLGGRVALHLALRHPELVEFLVLESSSPGIDDAHERIARREVDERWATQLERDGLPAFLDAWYAQPLFASLRERPDLLAAIKARRLHDRSPAHVAELAATLRGCSPGFIPSLWSRLPQWRAPLLFVAGERDAKFVETGRRVADLCPRASLSIVRASGHLVHEEQPANFMAALRAFPPLAGGFQ